MISRLAVVCARPAAVPPPGVDARRFATACRADTYDVVADLDGVVAGVLDWPATETEDLWPDTRLYADRTPSEVLALVSGAGEFGAVVLVPPDVPDLPGLVLAKVFQALGRAAVAVAPAEPGPGWAALGVGLPLPPWWPAGCLIDPDVEGDLVDELQQVAPRRNLVVRTPGWHRLREPASVMRLDPGLEGWEQTRALLSARARPRAEGAESA